MRGKLFGKNSYSKCSAGCAQQSAHTSPWHCEWEWFLIFLTGLTCTWGSAFKRPCNRLAVKKHDVTWNNTLKRKSERNINQKNIGKNPFSKNPTSELLIFPLPTAAQFRHNPTKMFVFSERSFYPCYYNPSSWLGGPSCSGNSSKVFG